MPRCEVVTAAGRPCRNTARAGDTRCGIHHFHQQVVRCRDCRRHAVIDGLCRQHHDILHGVQQNDAGEDLWDEIRWGWRNGEDVRELEEMINDAYDVGTINRMWFRVLMLRLAWLEIGFEIVEEDEEVAEDAGNLQAFAEDPQSVHRAPVSEQTNRGLDVLLAVAVPPETKTLEEIATAWTGRSHVKRITADMRRWYARSTCREDGDWLYKRTLDGLWTMIKASEHRVELTQRLFEESDDACKMCCDGHITRLVNVMVGFDDRFNPPVSQAELVQQQMAAIGAKDISVEEKALEAWVALEGLGVPEVDRVAWIDAF